MQPQEERLNDLITRLGYKKVQRGSNQEEIWVEYNSRATKSLDQCLIGTYDEISELDESAVKQCIEEKTWKRDHKILSGIQDNIRHSGPKEP